MKEEKEKVMVWLQNGKILKSVSNANKGIIRIINHNDNVILKRTGLSRLQIKQIEFNIKRYGLKKLEHTAKPFRFLGK